MRASILALTILVACGGSDGLTSHEGVYAVATWTSNPSGCDAEGPSIAELQDPFFFIKSENVFGEEFINVNVCPTAEACAADARDDSTLHIGQWGFQSGDDGSGWTDDSAFAFDVDGTCQATRVQTRMTFDGTSVTIEERTSRGTFAPDATGECGDDAAAAATANSPCETLEVVTADFELAF